jgi:hypothetical protein
VISQLDQQFVTEVEYIITSPPQQDTYITLQTELVNRLCPSRDQRARHLFTLEVMVDHKPSQLLKHLTSLAPDRTDYTFCNLWASRLPANIQTSLADMPNVGLEAAALCADCIIEAVSPSTIASISQRQYGALEMHRRSLSPRRIFAVEIDFV